ncbi:MAG: hypothetical protein M9936_23185 [Caldilinea sp.]|nr:hypothetical protein [Caldilinea sp.]
MTNPSPHRRPARAVWLVLAALMVAAILTVAGPARPAAASCGGTTTVGTEAQLNAAIAAFNAVAAGPCVFTIALSGNIDLTASTAMINNATTGVSLVIEGAAHTVDGQGKLGVRGFWVWRSTHVVINQITVKGGNLNDENGAGIRNEGNLTLTNSTITGNSVTGTKVVGGGGIENARGATLTVRNSTISGNSSAQTGGGIGSDGDVTLDSVTITNNSSTTCGSGYCGATGSLTIRNSIIAGNTGAPDCRDVLGNVTDQGHNLVQSQSNCGIVNGANGNIVGVSANLGALADNGGPTQTHLPNAGSPVINAGDTTLTTDQRGIARPQGAADDIGAVEIVACPAFPVDVATAAELNAAIACFNAETSSGLYDISLSQNITLTASTTVISNSTTGVALQLIGNGFAVDGQGISGVRPFEIAAGTSVNISDITIRGGNPDTDGGGIRVLGNLVLTDATVSSNTTGGAGGGISINGGGLTASRIAVTGNVARGAGGGVYQAGQGSIKNSTISGNSAADFGGGLVSEISGSNITLDSVTIANNVSNRVAAGMSAAAGGSINLRNSIVANNTGAPDCDAAANAGVIDNGYNLVESPGTCAASLTGTGTILNQDPLLGPLALNGGLTLNHLPLPGSPALNAGDTTLTIDQRGEPRPAGPADDIGAVENQAGSLTIVKKTVGGDGTFSYSSPQLGDFRLTTQKKTAQRTFAGLAPGTYNVSEAPTQGWDLTNAICSNGSNPASITVGAGEAVTCSFTNVKRGSITVVKTSAGGDAAFPFTSTALGGFSLTTVGGTAQRTFDNLLAGTYDLAESTPAGWAQTGATCSDGSTLPTINLAAGEDVTCTFANAKQGSLTVVKQATGADTTFTFDSTALGAFDLTTVNGTAQKVFTNLNPGTYDIFEDDTPGWQLVGFPLCSNGQFPSSVNLNAGEDITCTFTNRQLDTILAIKLALGGDDAFPFTSTALGAFTLTTTSGYAVQAFTGLTPGSYDLAETPVAGWTMAEADPTCSNGDKASAHVGTGETIVCLFVNYKPDTIIVEKRTVGGDGAFGFTSNLPGAGSFSLTTVNGTATRSFTGLAPATYKHRRDAANGAGADRRQL